METGISKYAYSVSCAHLYEKYFFSRSDVDKLLNASSYEAVIASLVEKGWNIPEDSRDTNMLLDNEMTRAWNTVIAYTPDISVFYPLILRNDYHNLKAGIKSLLTGFDTDMHFIRPSIISPDLMKEAVEEQKFELLPEPFNTLGKEIYDLLVTTADGQKADIIIDRKCLEETLKEAKKTGVDIIKKMSEIYVASSNIKTAFRAIRTGKSSEFLEQSLAEGCTSVDKNELIKAISGTNKDENEKKANKSDFFRLETAVTEAPEQEISKMDALLNYLSTTEYAEGIKLLSSAPADYEKWVDDYMLSFLIPTKNMPLGAEPITGFYIGKEAEVKNIRIILAAKQNNLPTDMIKGRLRRLYE